MDDLPQAEGNPEADDPQDRGSVMTAPAPPGPTAGEEPVERHGPSPPDPDDPIPVPGAALRAAAGVISSPAPPRPPTTIRPPRRTSRRVVAVGGVLVLAAGAVTWWLNRAVEPPPVPIQLRFEQGRVYPYRIELRTGLKGQAGGARVQHNSHVQGLASLRALSVRNGVATLRGPIEAPLLVINGTFISKPAPILLDIRVRTSGGVVCGGIVEVPTPEGLRFVGTFGIPPALADQPVTPGARWSASAAVRKDCGGPADGRLRGEGTYVQAETVNGEEAAFVIVRSQGPVRGPESWRGRATSEDRAWIDPARGEVVRAEGFSKLRVQGMLPGVSSPWAGDGWTSYELSTIP